MITKPKIVGPPSQFFLKALTPPRDFGKNVRYPFPWILNQCASIVCVFFCFSFFSKIVFTSQPLFTRVCICQALLLSKTWKLFRSRPDTQNDISHDAHQHCLSIWTFILAHICGFVYSRLHSTHYRNRNSFKWSHPVSKVFQKGPEEGLEGHFLPER